MDLDGLTAEVDELLADADEAFARQFPGAGSERGPIQTFYVGAGDFHPELLRETGREAEQLLLQHAEEFLALLAGDDALMGRVLEKLATEPVEDVRLDFTPWTGDRVVDRAAQAWLRAAEADDLPARGGIRIPSLGPETRGRALRSLIRFLDAVGSIPEGFVVTVRDVVSVAQVEALLHLAERLEKELQGHVRFEAQLESPQAVLGPKGSVVAAKLLHASDDRLVALHLVPEAFGAARIADHALTACRTVIQGTPVRLGDGTTAPEPAVEEVVTGWGAHLDFVRRSLARGFVQGRDTVAAQLPTRYAATFAHQAHESAGR
jgi:hypothetical protein